MNELLFFTHKLLLSVKLVRIGVVLVDWVVVSLRRLLDGLRLLDVDYVGNDDGALHDLALRVVNNLLLHDGLCLHARIVIMRQIVLIVVAVNLTILLIENLLLLLPAVVEHASQKDTDPTTDQKAKRQGDDGNRVDEVNAVVEVVDVLWIETVILEALVPELLINLGNVHGRERDDGDEHKDGR